MQNTSENRTTVQEGKKTWRRPDFVFVDTAMEVTAYAGRN
ncbi:pyrroloquinoline quinone precursor peptide PqqA [Nocardia transvalensis]|nr:pyrroloquinoline quinone precursor peptide PqqA [Nocardia transvalensis]MBF6327695.1 pyrroloquinoline quinone precursor peptide PqqA [Nocardia transvalensis]